MLAFLRPVPGESGQEVGAGCGALQLPGCLSWTAGTGMGSHFPARIFLARRNTASSISSVNLPVEVFCWLG
jgi:hypothetical protein